MAIPTAVPNKNILRNGRRCTDSTNHPGILGGKVVLWLILGVVDDDPIAVDDVGGGTSLMIPEDRISGSRQEAE